MSAAITEQPGSRGLKRFFEQHRTLGAYPTGAYRYGLLLLAIVANVIIYYDLAFAGILPLWISSLHFTAKQFGASLVLPCCWLEWRDWRAGRSRIATDALSFSTYALLLSSP
jgi:hypothetical protein